MMAMAASAEPMSNITAGSRRPLAAAGGSKEKAGAPATVELTVAAVIGTAVADNTSSATQTAAMNLLMRITSTDRLGAILTDLSFKLMHD